MVEILGYLASFIVVISLSMSNVVRLRIVGLIGSVLFLIYGLLVGAIPVAITNGVIIVLHVYYLWQAYTREVGFELLEVRADSLYLQKFLDFHRTTIDKTQPQFSFDVTADHLVFFILRDMLPTALFIGRPGANGDLAVELDFVIPEFRDLKAARFLFHLEPDKLGAHGVRSISTRGETDLHRSYLQKIGFENLGEDRYQLVLAN